MAKFSAEELSARINDLELDDDVKISLMEDITDSITPEESEELKTLKSEMEDLLRYSYSRRYNKSNPPLRR